MTVPVFCQRRNQYTAHKPRPFAHTKDIVNTANVFHAKPDRVERFQGVGYIWQPERGVLIPFCLKFHGNYGASIVFPFTPSCVIPVIVSIHKYGGRKSEREAKEKETESAFSHCIIALHARNKPSNMNMKAELISQKRSCDGIHFYKATCFWCI